MRLLIAGQGGFLAEAQDVLRAGLTHAAWVSVDDTGARHKAANGVCTQIGNDHFAWFGSTASKSRLNFLDLLRAGYTDYVINAEALAYMHDRGLAGPAIAKLAEAPDQRFADAATWHTHLSRLGIACRARIPVWRPCRTRCGWPAKARSGAASRRTASWPRRSSSATMPGSSASAATPCAGFMPNASCTSWMRSPTCISVRR